MRRVVVTGLGMISPLGTGRSKNWTGLTQGLSGIDNIRRFDTTGCRSHIAGEVKDFHPEQFFGGRDRRRLDRFLQFAIAAAILALRDAQLEISDSSAARCGVYLGSGVGGLQSIETARDTLRDSGPRRISPFAIPQLLTNLAAGEISIRFGLKGPSFSLASACASGTHSLGEAARAIRFGFVDVMFAGASEAALTPLSLAGFSAMRALARCSGDPKTAMRPFERDRTGFVLAEGAAVLVLEALEHAQDRGAEIYCELAGYGATSDAHHVTVPEQNGDGAARCIRLALRDAQVDRAEVDHVNAHGTATRHNDRVETHAIKQVFGEHAHSLWVSANKSMIGHTLGAAGALEAAVCAQSIKTGVVPPTINYDHPDPECDLDYVPNVAREARQNVAVSNSFGFGGTNASLVFKRFA